MSKPKPTYSAEQRILNMQSGFQKKLLCDGPTFTAGTACFYSCSFCYVPAMRLLPKNIPENLDHSKIIVRRSNPENVLRNQLLTTKGTPKFKDPKDTRTIYTSPLVDIAANMEMTRETTRLCKIILELTHWNIRLLSKSNLLPKIAQELEEDPNFKDESKKRIVYGVSTGTPNNSLAKAFEEGTPLVSKRIESLLWLQNNGFRTFGMICPSLPQPNKDYSQFSQEICEKLRINHPSMEHIWAEVINVRGESLSKTTQSLEKAGFHKEAELLTQISQSKEDHETYNRETFLGHKTIIPKEKLRYLVYVSKNTLPWWKEQEPHGAIIL